MVKLTTTTLIILFISFIIGVALIPIITNLITFVPSGFYIRWFIARVIAFFLIFTIFPKIISKVYIDYRVGNNQQ